VSALPLRHWWLYGPLVVYGCSGCVSALPADHPCSEENPRAAAFLASCATLVKLQCDADPKVPCEVEAECERAWAERCEQ
jgi:hypothetical protein